MARRAGGGPAAIRSLQLQHDNVEGRPTGPADQIHNQLPSPTKMRIDWQLLLGWLQNRPETARALAALPGAKLDRDLVLSSLAADVETLVAGNSAFDRYYFGNGDSAIDRQAKNGFRLFVCKNRCSGCHQATGIGFADGADRATTAAPRPPARTPIAGRSAHSACTMSRYARIWPRDLIAEKTINKKNIKKTITLRGKIRG